MDPLQVLPAEIVLRILDFASVSTVAKLTRLSKSWHGFNHTHQDTVYSSPSKTCRPDGTPDLSFMTQSQSFAKFYDGTSSWKELCKRQTLLARNWNSREPVTRESVIQVGNDAVWRFRADFKRRFFLSTSQQGGLNVTDMDTGELLWSLSTDEVRPFAHLEYQDGTAVWDREGNAIEIWKTDLESLPRGEFRRVAILPHDRQTRGFQLSYNELCVVSTEGQAYVYDMTRDLPRRTTTMEIESDAVGHLDQNADVVLICMGKKGYHVHDKASGVRIGILEPKRCQTFFHIEHPPQQSNSIISTGSTFDSLPSVDIFPARRPSKERFTTLSVAKGPFLEFQGEAQIHPTPLDDDEWGAALFSGSFLVAISRGGRVLICPDWKTALQDQKKFEASSYIIECMSDGSTFDLGGWLSVQDFRIMFEVQDRIYLIDLQQDGGVAFSDMMENWRGFAFNNSSATQLAVPVSFMSLHDDCILSTYTTLGWRRRSQLRETAEQNRFRIFPTKTIRVLSLAPSLNADNGETSAPSVVIPSSSEEERHASILEIMDMLSEEEEEESDAISDEHELEGVW